MPPIAASSKLSVISWRIMRYRLAPSASRRDISALRAAARDSNKFPTLPQAINSTRATITISICRAFEYAIRRPEIPRAPATSFTDVLAIDLRRSSVSFAPASLVRN